MLPVLLVDGSSYVYRAYHATAHVDLRTQAGLPSGAVRTLAAMLKKMCDTYADYHIVVVFDAKGPTFRHELYGEYKATRASMPPELAQQMAAMHRLVEGFGLPILMESGVEADDVIGTLARAASAQGQRVLISSGDKDLAQLVDERITLVDTMKGETTDLAGVETRFGVPPHLIADLLAIIGDTSDNIPGMKGAGPKTAVPLLLALGDIDSITARADEIAGVNFRGAKTFAPKWLAAIDTIRLCKRLTTIKTDVAVALPAYTPRVPDVAMLQELYTTYELKSLLKGLTAGAARSAGSAVAPVGEDLPPQACVGTYRCVLTEAELAACLDELWAAEVVAFDTETTGLDRFDAQWVGVSFSTQAGTGYYIPFGHDYLGAPAQLSQATVVAAVKPLLENPHIKKIGHHLKFDSHVLANAGIALQGIYVDTLLASYVFNSTATKHNLAALALRYLGLTSVPFESLVAKGMTFKDVELTEATTYAAEDADLTLRLYQYFWPKLGLEQKNLVQQLEVPLIPVLVAMERHGTPIIAEQLQQHSLELGQRLGELERLTYAAAGKEFNLKSPKQVGEVLFTELQLPVLKKTPKGEPSTNEEVLQELASAGHEVPHYLLEYRTLDKLKSTYTDTLPVLCHPKTGRLHTSYQQTVTATGRLSSSEPNLQNIPIRTAEGRKIRQAFGASAGYVIVAADYSQIELRIMAYLSQDAGLIRAFAAGEDIHRATAADILGIPLADVTAEGRRRAKAINFGLIYGMSAFGLSRQLGISRGEATAYIEQYFAKYPGVQRYMEAMRAQVLDKGYVETVFGRRLYLPDSQSKHKGLQKAAERAAINAPMQGTAADIIKLAMIQLMPWLVAQGSERVRLLMQVHDELVFEVRADEAAAACRHIQQTMEQVVNWPVPLLVEVGVGQNWDEAH